ncbi:MAG: MFS transporter, partial [Chloroflexota bacterium]
TMGHNITRILGPSAAGFLLATVGVQATFLWVTVVLVGVMATTLVVRVPPITPPSSRPGVRGVWQELAEGFIYVRDHRELFGLMVMALIPIVMGMSFVGLLPVFARDIFGTDARGVGELLAAGGIGSMIGTLVLASLSDRLRHRGAVLFWNGAAMAVALVAFAVSPFYPLSFVLMLLVGLFSMAQIVVTSAGVQMLTPPEYMGRVMSIYMLDRGLMPVGSFVAGALAQWAGAPVAMAAMGVFCLLFVGLGAVALPEVRKLD